MNTKSAGGPRVFGYMRRQARPDPRDEAEQTQYLNALFYQATQAKRSRSDCSSPSAGDRALRRTAKNLKGTLRFQRPTEHSVLF